MTIFKGTAEYYAKYRPQYPEWVIKTLADKLHLDGKGSLLDVGCGTGTLAIPLSKYFDKVLAVDIDPEMIEEGRRIAKGLGIKNIEWLAKNGEELDNSIGTFKIITFGNSLHWFDMDKILKFAYSILEPNGAVVDVGGSSIWRYAPEAWQQKTLEVIKKYLGEERRTIQGKYKTPSKKYSEYIQDAGFKDIQTWEFYFDSRLFKADEVINAQFSTSYASRELLGKDADNFANDLKAELLKINPDNKFPDKTAGSVVIGWK
ncbi:MAG: class I SAM-dependent methyltransferase [bacterium]|nr:class I SAM-dependent methyltransferase [bacterium]